MGQAICSGLLGCEEIGPEDICVANPGAQKREHIEKTYGVRTVRDAREGLPADVIVLAVKPNIVCEVASQLAETGIGRALLISIAAGVSTARLEACFAAAVPVVRVMPNTPLRVGAGMSVLSAGAHASDEQVTLARALFSSMGHALVVPESSMDAVTAISGSGPAYFELVAETIARSGEELGLAYETARELAVQTMYGTAALLEETGQDLAEAIEEVSSPGGTTVAALDAMRENGLEKALRAGVRAAERRSFELGAS